MFKGYNPNVRFRSTLLVNPQALHSSTIPPTEDLIALQDELQDIRSRALERIRKSNSDLVLFKEKWDRSKEREKNRDALARERTKNKVKESLYNKIKREPSETPSVDEAPLIARGGTTIHRKGYESFALVYAPEMKGTRSNVNAMREGNEIVLRTRSTLNFSTPLLSDHRKKAKLNNHVSQLTIPPPAPEPPIDPDVATDFTLPPSVLANVRPVLGLWGEDNLLRSMPSTPLEVTEDFTNVKPPGTQAQIGPFWKEVDSWLRPVGEEDVAWTDDTELFRVPKLGRHYSEVWEEETAPPSHYQALRQSTLLTKGLGPLTERVISALLSVPGQPPPKKGDDDNPAPNASGTTTQLAPVSFHDMETRLKIELRACGLLGTEEPNFAESYDDDIASEIRRLQAELRSVKRVNDARKERLTTFANDRLAYQDYLEMLDDLNKQIGFGANHKASAGKKKKGPGQKEGGDAASEASRAKTLVMDVPESLVKVIEVRKQFKEVFGTAMLEWETRFPGQNYGPSQNKHLRWVEAWLRRV
ncbi:hypothetical protein BS47DRAFT_1357078 [Hydnum rufescens UP504]|uniref:Uncharacterized protein n=1 Tax=Hydnum rufescens UP504 TaxID=1448309 RepID=A0A9P6BCH1_9AGAM|nr:hypothetical protein BS47DRAFT_1357078 [Hydnum rufescens UP504]